MRGATDDERTANNLMGFPRERKSVIARYYDGEVDYWSEVYLKPWETFPAFELARRREIVLRLVDGRATPGARVADIGCGSGGLLLDLLERGFEVAGVDISERMVQTAREAMDQQFPGRGACVVGDIDALPFEAGSFDAAVVVGVLSHQPDPRHAMAELARVVSDGGFVVVTVVNLLKLPHLLDPYTLFAVASRWFGRLLPGRGGSRPGVSEDVRTGQVMLRKYRHGELRAVLEGSGLRIREVIPVAFGPFGIWRKPALSLVQSVQLSRNLERAADARLRLLGRFANSWVVCLEKSTSR